MHDVVALTRPRLSILVVVSCAIGEWLAPGHIAPAQFVFVLVATAILVAGAQALNGYLERDVDAVMARTCDRPLASGRLEPRLALYLGLGASLAGVVALGALANVLTAGLGALALVAYVLAYTPLKRHTSAALPVGAVAGALPILMGWTAVTQRIDAPGLSLFAVIFAWQLPHFLSISLYLHEDYRNAGLRVFSVVHGERVTRRVLAATTMVLLPVSLLPVAAGVARGTYGAIAALLGFGLCALTLVALRSERPTTEAREVFWGSLIYLVLLMAGLALDKTLRLSPDAGLTMYGEVLAGLNALLNATAATLLVFGFAAIRRNERARHHRLMLSTVAVSGAFLVSYVTRMLLTGTHRFPDVGALRTIYLVVLASHTLLAMAVVPLVAAALYYAFTGRFVLHRAVARWLWPIWLYVSVTGVVVYVMLYQLAPRLG